VIFLPVAAAAVAVGFGTFAVVDVQALNVGLGAEQDAG
jgi:hypothetical protein